MTERPCSSFSSTCSVLDQHLSYHPPFLCMSSARRLGLGILQLRGIVANTEYLLSPYQLLIHIVQFSHPQRFTTNESISSRATNPVTTHYPTTISQSTTTQEVHQQCQSELHVFPVNNGWIHSVMNCTYRERRQDNAEPRECPQPQRPTLSCGVSFMKVE